MRVKTGLLEIGTRDWGRWIFQIYWPTVKLNGDEGFVILWDLLAIRVNPKNKAYALILLGFGIGIQKAKPKPEKKDGTL